MITNSQLFYIINKTIKEEKSELFKILDYASECITRTELDSVHFDVVSRTVVGASEGVYTSILAEGFFKENKFKSITLGTYKTLIESKDAFRQMSMIGTEFSIAAYDFLNSYMDDIESSKVFSKNELEALQNDFADSYSFI